MTPNTLRPPDFTPTEPTSHDTAQAAARLAVFGTLGDAFDPARVMGRELDQERRWIEGRML